MDQHRDGSPLTAAESQLLVAILTYGEERARSDHSESAGAEDRAERAEEADGSCMAGSHLQSARSAVEELGATYFCSFKLDWSVAWKTLNRRGVFVPEGHPCALTDWWDQRARQVRALRPRYRYWYNDWYRRGLASPAHGELCARVYGRDLCQTGMATTRQLDLVRETAARELTTTSGTLLDMGCGAGLQTEYLRGGTGWSALGIDTVVTAVRAARRIVSSRSPECAFELRHMVDHLGTGLQYDLIVAVDSVYFVGDQLSDLVGRCLRRLRPGGRFIALYSAWPGKDQSLTPEATAIAQAADTAGAQWEAIDLTDEERDHWLAKRRVIAELKDRFYSEGNQIVYQKRMGEAGYFGELAERGRISRFLYVIGEQEGPKR